MLAWLLSFFIAVIAFAVIMPIIADIAVISFTKFLATVTATALAVLVVALIGEAIIFIVKLTKKYIPE